MDGSFVAIATFPSFLGFNHGRHELKDHLGTLTRHVPLDPSPLVRSSERLAQRRPARHRRPSTDIKPMCPHCEQRVERLLVIKKGWFTDHRVYCCPKCEKIVGVNFHIP